MTLLWGCSAFAQPSPGGAGAANSEKIDPALKMEVDRLIKEDQGDQPVEVIIRSRSEMEPAQRAVIEQKGGILGAIIGDVSSARIPAQSVSEIAGLEWIVYLEKPKKHRPR